MFLKSIPPFGSTVTGFLYHPKIHTGRMYTIQRFFHVEQGTKNDFKGPDRPKSLA
jgi:hypothetical protein